MCVDGRKVRLLSTVFSYLTLENLPKVYISYVVEFCSNTTKTTYTHKSNICRVGDLMHIFVSIVGYLKIVQKAYEYYYGFGTSL